MLEFVDSGLCFVQDENKFINPLLQIGPDPDPKKKYRILIPSLNKLNHDLF